MDRAISFLAGVGLGAGLMYVLDPQMGRRRRALARDQFVRLAHEAEDAAGVVARDMRNRAQGVASGDLSVLAGGKRALKNLLAGSWSPSARALMGLLGGGLFLYGLTRTAPTSCLLGTVGLALAAEGFANAGIDDLTRLPQTVAEKAAQVPGKFGFGGPREEPRGAEGGARTVAARA
jgi:hypothetical protein